MAKRITRAEQLAEFFRRSPGRWHDARELFGVAGAYGWRSRISDLRRSPFNLDIRNRQRTIRQAGGRPFVVSEYRLVLPPSSPADASNSWELTP